MSYLLPNYSNEYTIIEHFYNTPGDQRITNTNVSGSQNNNLLQPDRIGTRRIVLGTGDVGTTVGYRYSTNIISFGSGLFITDWTIRPMSLSPAVNNPFVVILGFIDNVGIDPINGMYFEYDTQNGGDFWRCCTSANSTKTKFTTSYPINTGVWTNLKVEVNPSATNVNYYINGNQVGSISTNIPKGNQTTSIGLSSRKVSGNGVQYNVYDVDLNIIYFKMISGLYP